MENDPFIVDLPIKTGDFPISFLLVYHRVDSMGGEHLGTKNPELAVCSLGRIHGEKPPNTHVLKNGKCTC